MNKLRLDQALVQARHLRSRSQAESYIKLGKVSVNGQVITKPGHPVSTTDDVQLVQKELYVSRAGLKLAGAAEKFKLDFAKKMVLDVGSSTGGFTDYALRHGAVKVIAVDVGSGQMHPSLRGDKRIELHEKTDIRNFQKRRLEKVDIVLIDVSFVSLSKILPAVATLCSKKTQIVVLAKPQFEASADQLSRGIVKNDTVRRRILSNFELWARKSFQVIDKSDSEIAGAHGNRERFYLLKSLQ